MPILGELRMFASGEPGYVHRLEKAGWIPCDGRSLNQLTFKSLFDALGTAWGSDDIANSFRVPDLRGLFVRGWAPTSPHDVTHVIPKRDPGVGGREPLQHFFGLPTEPGASGFEVGSFEHDMLKRHHHTVPKAQEYGARIEKADGAETYLGQGFSGTLDTSWDPTSKEEHPETRPRNVYAFIAIFSRGEVR